MAASLEETLISVWRQVLVEDAKTVARRSRRRLLRTRRGLLRRIEM
jgi:hypothetical protein